MKLENNIIFSYVKFYLNTSEVYTNKKIKGIYNKCDINFKADLYDLYTYCCCFFLIIICFAVGILKFLL